MQHIFSYSSKLLSMLMILDKRWDVNLDKRWDVNDP